MHIKNSFVRLLGSVVLLLGAVVAFESGSYNVTSIGILIGGFGAGLVLILDYYSRSGSYLSKVIGIGLVVAIVILPILVGSIDDSISVVISGVLCLFGYSIQKVISEINK